MFRFSPFCPATSSAARLGVFLALVGMSAAPASASKVDVHALETYGDFAAGSFEGTRLTSEGTVELGAQMSSWSESLNGAVLAMAQGGDGEVYVAVPNPGRIFRVKKGASPVLVATFEAPLVTALVPWGRDQLVALVGPKAQAVFVNLKAKAGANIAATIALPDVELGLDAVALEGSLYIVGGGDEGVLVRIQAGKSTPEVLARVEDKLLRSVAAAKTARGEVIAVGSSSTGTVYRLEAGRLRALVDASASEVVDLAIDKDGRVFAAIVDAEGKLSAGALAAAKSDEAEKPEGDKSPAKAQKPKPRKVQSSEVWRIDASGGTEILWQSKRHGAYALAIDGDHLLLGTGAEGRVYRLSAAGGTRAELVARAVGHDEVLSFAPHGKGSWLLATANSGAVLELSPARRKDGVYLSPALDAKALASWGRLAWLSEGKVVVDVRTGNTKEPDDTWTAFSPPLSGAGVPVVPPGRYAQVRFKLTGGASEPSVRFARLAFLRHNRAPRIASVDVVGPGWRVEPGNRERSHERSVSFGAGAFNKFKEQRGSVLPDVGERPSGKQTFERGFRTIYAHVQDADADTLRYRFLLAQVDGKGAPAFKEIKGWSEDPFVSFDASTLRDGAYRVKVEVDDYLTNGPDRVRTATGESAAFVVAHQGPRFSGAKASAVKGGVRLTFDVSADRPLSAVLCSVGVEAWVPVDPRDGILDSESERFDVVVPGATDLDAVSCQAVDEALNEARVDIRLQ